MKLRRRSLLLCVSAAACLSAAAGALFLSGFLGGFLGRDPEVAVPAPSAEAAALCRALHRELPRTVDGLSGRAVRPESDLTAGWGDPAVVLRCGVPRPAVLTPGDARYDPGSDAVEVNGVLWLAEQQDDGYRFVTVGRKAFVEVTVPGRYAPEVDPLVDLGGAIRRTVPAEL